MGGFSLQGTIFISHIVKKRDMEYVIYNFRVMSVSGFMGYLKSKSSLMVFDRHANLKYKYGNRHFWCRGYYVDTVGKYENAIKDYIKNQLQEDIMADQLSLKEFIDPFTGSRSEKGKLMQHSL